MYLCMRALGQRRAEVMIEMVREATGKDCPCLRGVPCPYFEPVDLPSSMPLQRDEEPVTPAVA